MTRIAPAIGLAIIWCLLAGCARIVWTRPDFTEADFRADSYACERDVRQSGYYGTGYAGALNAQGFFDRCMESKGYYQARVEAASHRPSRVTGHLGNRRKLSCACGSSGAQRLSMADYVAVPGRREAVTASGWRSCWLRSLRYGPVTRSPSS